MKKLLSLLLIIATLAGATGALADTWNNWTGVVVAVNWINSTFLVLDNLGWTYTFDLDDEWNIGDVVRPEGAGIVYQHSISDIQTRAWIETYGR